MCPRHRRACRAHPRSRGENGLGSRGNQANGGSSPLTRGKPSQSVNVSSSSRLIPAHAGKTSAPPEPSAATAAHPRSRGENPATTGLTLGFAGSSPLTRGKPGATAAGLAGHGLIPAHAGKTRSGNRRRPSQRAHPRSRGENAVSCCHAAAGAGSSPLTRGKLDRELLAQVDNGLIPA